MPVGSKGPAHGYTDVSDLVSGRDRRKSRLSPQGWLNPPEGGRAGPAQVAGTCPIRRVAGDDNSMFAAKQRRVIEAVSVALARACAEQVRFYLGKFFRGQGPPGGTPQG